MFKECIWFLVTWKSSESGEGGEKRGERVGKMWREARESDVTVVSAITPNSKTDCRFVKAHIIIHMAGV